jgi:hypothetical protein
MYTGTNLLRINPLAAESLFIGAWLAISSHDADFQNFSKSSSSS